tara:strand:+ start:193 stop:417 length:225 start_codon:yes stop_codon:yes gene_type:complete
MEFTTEIEEAEVTISFDYQPEEPVVMYYPDGSGNPGYPASVDNISVYWKELDITELLKLLGHDVEKLCWNHLDD